MRIGFEYMLPGAQDSGVEVAIRELLLAHLELLPDDDDIDLWISSRTSVASLSLPHNVHVRRSSLAHMGRLGRIAWQQVGGCAALRRHPVDVYHATGYVASPMLPVPTLVSVYDTLALDHPAMTRLLNSVHYRLAVPRGLRAAAAVAVPSEHVRRRLLAATSIQESRVHVVPLGVSRRFERMQPEIAGKHMSPLALRPECPFALFVGNLERKKNLGMLVKAYSQLLQSDRTGLKLVIAGKTGNDAVELRSLVHRLGLDHDVIVCGYVSDDTLVALYSSARFVVYPSLDEGFGLPPLEAMACGTPVICTKAGALPETVGEAAILVRPNEPRELLEAMRGLNENAALRARYAERGPAHASRYSWHACAAKTRALYHLLASQTVSNQRAPRKALV